MNRLCNQPLYGIGFLFSKFCLFLSVTVATIVGTVVAFLLVPMRSLGQDNWKIAAALMGSYIGGCKFTCQE
jgi:uncharacterized membrane protein